MRFHEVRGNKVSVTGGGTRSADTSYPIYYCGYQPQALSCMYLQYDNTEYDVFYQSTTLVRVALTRVAGKLCTDG